MRPGWRIWSPASADVLVAQDARCAVGAVVDDRADGAGGAQVVGDAEPRLNRIAPVAPRGQRQDAVARRRVAALDDIERDTIDFGGEELGRVDQAGRQLLAQVDAQHHLFAAPAVLVFVTDVDAGHIRPVPVGAQRLFVGALDSFGLSCWHGHASPPKRPLQRDGFLRERLDAGLGAAQD